MAHARIQRRKDEAKVRQEIYSKLTLQEKLAKLNLYDYVATKERAKITRLMEKASKKNEVVEVPAAEGEVSVPKEHKNAKQIRKESSVKEQKKVRKSGMVVNKEATEK